MRAHTWLFRATVDGNLVASDSCPNSTFKALLDSRKARQEECLGVADTITFTCSDLSGTEPRTFSVEGFIHGCREIGGCSLNQWLPMNHIPELKAIDFEPVYPGHGQLDPRYRKHPTIQKFLAETSLEPSVDGKGLRFDFHGSSAEPKRPHLEESNTWLLRARFLFTGDRNFSHVLADRLDREKTYLQTASLIAYACSDDSATGTMQVEILVHAKWGNHIMRGTLMRWLDIDDIHELQELEIEPIRPGERKPYTSDPTVRKFYDETALAGDPAAAAGKRLRVIHLGTEEVNKGGRPKGSTKAAKAAAARAAADAAADTAAPATPSPPGGAGGGHGAPSAASTTPIFAFNAPAAPATV